MELEKIIGFLILRELYNFMCYNDADLILII